MVFTDSSQSTFFQQVLVLRLFVDEYQTITNGYLPVKPAGNKHCIVKCLVKVVWQ